MARQYNYQYAFYERNGVKYIAAISSYKKRTVKGIAKCNPEDVYDEEFGKRLAEARCSKKINHLRSKDIYKEYAKTLENLIDMRVQLNKLDKIYSHSLDREANADNEIESLINSGISN